MGPGNIVSNIGDPDPAHRSRSRVLPVIRQPRASDAAGVWGLVQKTPVLDANSAYAYLLLCTDFADTGAIAETRGGIVGFALGYRPPTRPDTWFVWQVAVAEGHAGRGLGGSLLDWVFENTRAEGARFLEATVTPSNEASWSLFRAFARRHGAGFREGSAFPSDLFPDAGHEAEVLIRIGPLDAHTPRA
jgi:L-2,4-diaminobutyric acid acetyltransferase